MGVVMSCLGGENMDAEATALGYGRSVPSECRLDEVRTMGHRVTMIFTCKSFQRIGCV